MFAGNESVNLLQLNVPVDLKKIRLFYMIGLETPLVQSVNAECFQAMKKVRIIDN